MCNSEFFWVAPALAVWPLPLDFLTSLRACSLTVEEAGAALVGKPQEVSRIGIHYAKTAQKMDMERLKWSMWSLLSEFSKQADRGRPPWYWKGRRPRRDGYQEAVQGLRRIARPCLPSSPSAPESTSGLCLFSTFSHWDEPKAERSRGSLIFLGERGWGLLERSQQWEAHHFFSDQNVCTWWRKMLWV